MKKTTDLIRYGSILAFVLGGSLSAVWADEAALEAPSVGEGKAVLEADAQKGFRLSPSAQEILGIKTQSFVAVSHLPKTSWIACRDNVGVFRVRDHWFQWVLIKKSDLKESDLKEPDFKKNDQIVVEGGPALRVVQMDVLE